MSDEIVEPTQYELANALEKIRGYWLLRPYESSQASFNRAKQEYITALKRYIEIAESVPLDLLTKGLDKKAKT
jgi:hypothetical protein